MIWKHGKDRLLICTSEIVQVSVRLLQAFVFSVTYYLDYITFKSFKFELMKDMRHCRHVIKLILSRIQTCLLIVQTVGLQL
jgi:hypothetical protein